MNKAETETGTALPRVVMPRRTALATLAGVAMIQPFGGAGFWAGAAHAEQAVAGTEGGEAGEAGVVLSEGVAGFLTQLGYFEGTYRIAAALYLGGEGALARAHLEESHHAFYEDITPALAELGAPGFAGEAEDFLGAVNGDAGAAAVKVAYEALLDALAANMEAATPSAYDRLMSVHELLKLAAAEYEGGVSEGRVELAIEYRDSWGFYATAKARAEAMAAGGDVALVKAGADVLAQLDGCEALYPRLSTDKAAVDASQLSVAAGWVEIIALRQG